MAEEDISDFPKSLNLYRICRSEFDIAEQSLDMIISLVYDECGGSTISKTRPWALGDKIKFLRKAFKRFVVLYPYAEQGIEILDSVEAISKKRHDLVHGVVKNVTLENGVFPIEKLDYRNNNVKNIQFDPKAFPNLAQELLDLGKPITEFWPCPGTASSKLGANTF